MQEPAGYPEELSDEPMRADLDDVVADQYAAGRNTGDPERVVQPSPAPGGHGRRNLVLLGVAVLCLIGGGLAIKRLGHHAVPDNPALASIQAIASSVPKADVKHAPRPEKLASQTVVYQPSVTPLSASTEGAPAQAAAPAHLPAAAGAALPAQREAPATAVVPAAVPVAAAPAPVMHVPAPAASAPARVATTTAPDADQRMQIEALTRALAKATAEAEAAKAALANAKVAAKPEVRYVTRRAPRAHLVAILKDGAVFKTEAGKTVVLSVGGQVP